MPSLVGDALLCGFYLNELLVKFLAREDDYEKLYKLFKRIANRELKQLRKKLKETLEMEEAAQILLSMKNGN
jgi:DNA repair protein RecO (recombination protein O)